MFCLYIYMCNFFLILNSLGLEGKQLDQPKTFHFNILSVRKPLTFQSELIFLLKLRSSKFVQGCFEERLENLPFLSGSTAAVGLQGGVSWQRDRPLAGSSRVSTSVVYHRPSSLANYCFVHKESLTRYNLPPSPARSWKTILAQL